MALTNPDKLINVRELDYFRQKADGKYRSESVMTAQQAGALFDSIFNPESDND